MEHFLLMELLAHRSHRDLGYGIHFWRTKSDLEVDYVLGEGEVAVEVKEASRVDPSDFRSLRAFVGDNRPRKAILVCNERAPRIVDGIEVLPWREFLSRLWGGGIVNSLTGDRWIRSVTRLLENNSRRWPPPGRLAAART